MADPRPKKKRSAWRQVLYILLILSGSVAALIGLGLLALYIACMNTKW